MEPASFTPTSGRHPRIRDPPSTERGGRRSGRRDAERGVIYALFAHRQADFAKAAHLSRGHELLAPRLPLADSHSNRIRRLGCSAGEPVLGSRGKRERIGRGDGRDPEKEGKAPPSTRRWARATLAA